MGRCGHPARDALDVVRWSDFDEQRRDALRARVASVANGAEPQRRACARKVM